MIVLVHGGAQPGAPARLADGEEHHLRVRRAAEGEIVDLRDGAGLVGTGRLLRAGREWRVQVEAATLTRRPPALTLAVGAGDRERFEWLVEKATELGVTCLAPVETERSAAVATRVRPQHLEKLRRRALEAVKQCGSAWVPELLELEPLISFLARAPAGDRWLADPAGGDAALTSDGSVTVVVGPEGGLTDAERAAAHRAGYRGVRLAPNMLRFETAAVAAAALAGAARLNVRRGADG
jgi:16S rRNA (uracil1498-N3)-methyltransferase